MTGAMAPPCTQSCTCTQKTPTRGSRASTAAPLAYGAVLRPSRPREFAGPAVLGSPDVIVKGVECSMGVQIVGSDRARVAQACRSKQAEAQARQCCAYVPAWDGYVMGTWTVVCEQAAGREVEPALCVHADDRVGYQAEHVLLEEVVASRNQSQVRDLHQGMTRIVGRMGRKCGHDVLHLEGGVGLVAAELDRGLHVLVHALTADLLDCPPVNPTRIAAMNSQLLPQQAYSAASKKATVTR
jgi:hypothetical protein